MRRDLARWWVLTGRTAELMVANRLTVAVLVGSPVLVIAMMTVLFRAGGFDHPADAPQVLFWLAFCAFFFGLTYGLLQIVTERDIQRRERTSGITPALYLASKLGVLLPVLAAVAAAMLTTLRITDRLPAMSGATTTGMWVTLTLIATAGLSLGLAASAAVADSSQATLALPMLCFPQVLFAGAVVPLDQMADAGRFLSFALATRWGFESLGRVLPRETEVAAARYPEVFLGSPVTGWTVLAISAAILLLVTARLLRR
jgi:hypothetical protein